MIVIKNLFLYRKTFLIVTLCEKDRRFQIQGILSKSTLFPATGATGLNKLAGDSFNVFLHVYMVAPRVQRSAIIIPWKVSDE